MALFNPPPHVVLVVDDEAVLRLDATEALRHAGHQTYEACETDEALALIAQHPEISVLFTDINMPGQRDGLALAGEVRRQRPDVRTETRSSLRRDQWGDRSSPS